MENRRSKDKARRATVSMIRLIADSLRDAIIMMDFLGTISYWNEAAERIFGFSAEETIGKNLHELIVPVESRAVHQKTFPMFQETGMGHAVGKTIELEALRKDGKKIKIQLSLSSLKVEGDWHAIGIVRDDTERSFHLEILQQQADVLDSAMDGIASLDQKQRYEYLNIAHAKIYGYEVIELLGKSWRTLYSEGELRMFDEKIIPELMRRGDCQCESVGMKKDGSFFPQELSLKILPNGKMTCVVRDISEKKKAEVQRKELEKFQAQLEKIETIGTVAGGIAHDFNNLLQGITGNLSLALLREDDPKARKVFVNSALDAALAATGLTQQLLTFSKGGNSVRKVGSVRDAIIQSIDFSVGKNSAVSCQADLAEDLWMVNFDSVQIGRVIQNLLINAKQAMPDGGEVLVRAENMNSHPNNPHACKDDMFVHVSVSDTGIGIPEKYLEKIFEPYFTTKGQNNGSSGFGLAICQSVIAKHDGILRVESEQGKGATFHIYLPATKEKLLAENVDKDAYKPSRQWKILVMDDEELLRNIARAMLEHFGHQVECAKDGQEALKMYSQGNFDCVMLDLTIPGGIDGVETLQRLKQINPDIVSIVSTGYADNFPEGFTAMLAKPYSVDGLIAVLREIETLI